MSVFSVKFEVDNGCNIEKHECIVTAPIAIVAGCIVKDWFDKNCSSEDNVVDDSFDITEIKNTDIIYSTLKFKDKLRRQR